MSDQKKIDELTKDPLLDHDYDGIKELDNPLPGWWLATFYIAIVFSGAYVLYYHIWNGPSIEDEFNQDITKVEALYLEEERRLSEKVENLDELMKDPEKLAIGKEKYGTNCASCHGMKGEGGIGPNMTDDYWLHGDGSPKTVLKVVKKGVLAKGMPAWESMLSIEEQIGVVAYLNSIRGTNVSNGKAPQGEKK